MKSNSYRHSSDSSDLQLAGFESTTQYDYESDGCSDADAETPAEQKIHKLLKKIENTKEDLIRLQAVKKDNVDKYLKSTDSITDTVSNTKTKLNFERNNQKTNNGIQLLQRKLEKYHYQVREVEEHGIHGSNSIIKTVQDHVRSGASSISDAVSKPLESFNNFIKKEKKISSTDNVFVINENNNNNNNNNYSHTNGHDEEAGGGLYQSIISTSDEERLSSGSASNVALSAQNSIGNTSTITASSRTEEDWELLKFSVQKLEQENKKTKEDITFYKEALNRMLISLQEERYKTDQVQGVLNDLFNQWNDLIELHQNEMMGVKEEMQHTIERIECVEYRFTERTAELHENVENCMTRITKQEKQTQEQQQPIDSFVTIDAKILMTKMLSFFINICMFCILIITSLSRLLMPFVSTRVRLITTSIAITSFIVLWHYADPEVVSVFVFIFIMIHCIYQIIC